MGIGRGKIKEKTIFKNFNSSRWPGWIWVGKEKEEIEDLSSFWQRCLGGWCCHSYKWGNNVGKFRRWAHCWLHEVWRVCGSSGGEEFWKQVDVQFTFLVSLEGISSHALSSYRDSSVLCLILHVLLKFILRVVFTFVM